MTESVDTTMLDKKQIISIQKHLQDNQTSPNPEAYAGFKFHNETSYTGGHFLAVRCAQGTLSCAKLPIDPTQGALQSAEVARYDQSVMPSKYDTSNATQTQTFTDNPTLNLRGSIALRAFLAQDRDPIILALHSHSINMLIEPIINFQPFLSLWNLFCDVEAQFFKIQA